MFFFFENSSGQKTSLWLAPGSMIESLRSIVSKRVLAAIREVCTRVCARGAECFRLHDKARLKLSKSLPY